MRVLRTLTGSAAHLPARNAYEAREPFPACTPVGTAVSNGVTRFYFHTADAVTCKRCLRILEKLVTEARAMHAQHMMTPEGQAQEDELAARRAERCDQCGSERSNPRHHSAEGHAFVEAEEGGLSGMYVELSSGLTEHVEPGDRLQHKDTRTLATVTAVGPNALDLLTDDGTRRSGASWYWGRPALRELVAELPEVAPRIVIDPSKYDSDAQLAEATAQVRRLRAAGQEDVERGPIDRQAVLVTRVDSLLDSGVTAGLNCPAGPACSGAPFPGHVAHEPVTDAQRAAELEEEGPLSRQLREVGSGSVQCPLLYAHAVHDWFTGGSAKSARRCAGLFEDRMPKLYTPTGEAMTVLGSAVHGGRTGLWGVREGRPLALAFFVDEDHLRLQFSAYRPGERARLADAARVATPVATPSQVAELAVSIAEQAELFAAGGVSEADGPAFRARMGDSVKRLAQWLGMSEPVSLASFASPYDANPLAE